MPDCRNEEMRDLLPDFAADRLSGQDVVRAAAHVAECPECAAEAELLQQARHVLGGVAGGRGVSDNDVQRIVAALPKPPVAVRTPLVARPRRVAATLSGRRVASVGRRPSWTALRVAAAVSTIAVGGLSVAVVRGTISSRWHGALAQHAAAVTGAVTGAASPSASGAVGSAPAGTTASTSTTAHVPSAGGSAAAPSSLGAAATAPTENAIGEPTAAGAGGLAVAGNISDLSDGEVESLLQDVDALDAAPSDEPEAAAPALPGVAVQ